MATKPPKKPMRSKAGKGTHDPHSLTPQEEQSLAARVLEEAKDAKSKSDKKKFDKKKGDKKKGKKKK